MLGVDLDENLGTWIIPISQYSILPDETVCGPITYAVNDDVFLAGNAIVSGNEYHFYDTLAE